MTVSRRAALGAGDGRHHIAQGRVAQPQLDGPGPRRNTAPDSRNGRSGRSLLHVLQGLLERTYRIETGVADIARFVIGDEGFKHLYGGESLAAARGPASGGEIAAAGSTPARETTAGRILAAGLADRVDPALRHAGSASTGARVLVRDGPGPIGVRIYYPDALIEHLERFPPGRGLGDENVDAFAAFVEELDHFLVIAERARLRRPVSLLELELHANVTKFLVCALFLARAGAQPASPRLEDGRRTWLLWHLFEKASFSEPEPEVQARYCEASRFGRRFIDRLERQSDPRARLELLRAFHDAGGQGKLSLLG